MSVSARKLSILLLSLGVLPVMSAYAADMPVRGPIPFEVMDKDGNKMISPQEFVEAHNMRKQARAKQNMRSNSRERSFVYFDTNGDNQISPEELENARASRQQMRGGQQGMGNRPQGMGNRPQGMGNRPQGMNQGRQMPKFADFDLNADGVLVEDEFYQARDARMRQRAEQGYPMRNAANAPPFGMLDTDRNGKVTEEEFNAHLARHQQRGQRP